VSGKPGLTVGLAQPEENRGKTKTAVTPSAAQGGVEAVREVACWRCSGGQWSKIERWVPEELRLDIFINGEEWLSILCSPHNLTCLVVGLLCSEGIISRPDEIACLRVCAEDGVAEVRLSLPVSLQVRRVLTSGCGGGSMSRFQEEKVTSVDGDLEMGPSQVTALAGDLARAAEFHRLSGGTHTSALSDGEKLLVLAEDIGRHNTLDKILGQCLLMGIPTRNRLLITTGRISSEMVLKAARMAVPLVISLTSPTAYAIALAQRTGMTLVGYARGSRFNVYTYPERIKGVQQSRC